MRFWMFAMGALTLAVVVGGSEARTASHTALPAMDRTADGGCDPAGVTPVGIVNFAFEPDDVEVPAGTVVEWTNTALAMHTSTEDYLLFEVPVVKIVTAMLDPPEWDSGAIAAQGSYELQFCDVGTFEYHCEFHANMRGTVRVA